MFRFHKLNILALAFCTVVATALSAATVEEELLTRPLYDSPSFSPDGSHLAFKTMDALGRSKLAVVDCDTLSPDIIEAIDWNNPDPRWRVKNIESYHWLSNERLVFVSDVDPKKKSLHYVRREGGNSPVLLKDKNITILDANPQTEEAIVSLHTGWEYGENRVVAVGPSSEERELYRCESVNFKAVTDRGHELRLVCKDESQGGPQAWYGKDAETGEWKKLSLESWATVYGMDVNPDHILVGSSHNSPTPAVQVFSISEDKFVANLIKHSRYSMDKCAMPRVSNALGGLVGLQIDANVPTPVWMNAIFKDRFQASIDNICKGSKNRILLWDESLTHLLVERIFPDMPTQYFLINNVETKADLLCVNGSPELEPQHTAEMKFVPIKTRDGVFLDSYVTTPKKVAKNEPLVVLVKDDPFNTRWLYDWNNVAQFLAGQGYVVLQLNFRGCGGMIGEAGNAFASVEDVQRIFEDYEDAINQLAEKQGIDALRVAFVGKGGASSWIATYAQVALPNSVKCSAVLSGVYDLVQYRNGEDDESIQGLGNIPFAHQGSQLSDEDLAKLSPMLRAKDMPGSIWVAYGTWSPEPQKEHQYKFSREAAGAGVDVEKNFSRSFYGASILDNKLYQEYYKNLASFLKSKL